MGKDDIFKLARLALRFGHVQTPLISIKRVTNRVHEVVRMGVRQSSRDIFRPKLWQYRQYAPRALRVPSAYALQPTPQNAPRIAVVTPSFNHARYLRATIDSMLAQRYSNHSYIVEDGGSTDGTLQLLESYGDKIVWRSQRDAGQGSAINRGFAQLDGEIMAYLNSDDTLLPGALAYVAHAFIADPDVDIVYGHRIFVDQDGLEIGRWVLPPHDAETIKWADYIPQETMFWRRRVWDKVGPLDESFRYALDWDFILRARAAGFRFKRLPRFLACFRVHDEQKSTAMIEVGNNEQRRLRQAHIGHDPSREVINAAVSGYLRRHIIFHRLYKLGLLLY